MDSKWMMLVVFVCGCAADAGGGTDSIGSEPSTTESVATTETGSTGATMEPISACGLAAPCEGFRWQCSAWDPDTCEDVAYGDALVCMLGALAAGDEAQLNINFNGLKDGEDEWLDIASPGGGAPAVRQYGIDNADGSGVYYNDPQVCTLRPAAFFEACLADDGGAAQHAECMDPYEWFEDDCVETTACP